MLTPVRKHALGSTPGHPSPKAETGPQGAGRTRAGEDGVRRRGPRPEAAFQKALVRRLRAAGEACMYVENEGARSYAAAQHWRDMGGEAGWGDLFLPLRGIAIECKAPDGEVSRVQQAHIDALRKSGRWEVFVARTFDDVPSYLQKDPEGWRPNATRDRLERIK